MRTRVHTNSRRIGASKYDSGSDDDGIQDIAEIPDLDDTGGPDVEEDITTKVADAPNVMSTKVQSLQELDRDAFFNLPSSAKGIDLSCLFSCLAPTEKVDDPDVNSLLSRTSLTFFSLCFCAVSRNHARHIAHPLLIFFSKRFFGILTLYLLK